MATEQFETIQFGISDSIATITLNRPERMNAFTTEMRQEICKALDLTDGNDDVRAVIFTGAGKAFCAGADLSSGGKTFDFKARADEARESMRVGDVYRDGGGIVSLRLFESRKPIIGAINGAAVGVGVTMQLPMDIRLASNKARFGFVFNRRGITPEAASSWFLTKAVGMQTALEWCYTGRLFDADEALAKGLVRSVHEPEDLLPAARAIAAEIATNAAPVSVALTLQMMWRMASVEHPMTAHEIDSRSIQARGQSADAREGIASFLEKRPAMFTDKVSGDMPEFYPWWHDTPFR